MDRAFEVDAALADLGIDLTESEYAQLLAACVAGSAPWTSTEVVLTRMGRELTTLQARDCDADRSAADAVVADSHRHS